MEPPEATLIIFPQEADIGMFLGTFTWVWSVMRANWLYSELPQPNTSPLSKMRRRLSIQFQTSKNVKAFDNCVLQKGELVSNLKKYQRQIKLKVLLQQLKFQSKDIYEFSKWGGETLTTLVLFNVAICLIWDILVLVFRLS